MQMSDADYGYVISGIDVNDAVSPDGLDVKVTEVMDTKGSVRGQVDVVVSCKIVDRVSPFIGANTNVSSPRITVEATTTPSPHI